MRKYIIFIVTISFGFLFSCSSQKKITNTFESRQKVISITPHKTLFLLTTIGEKKRDTMEIVLHKDDFFKEHGIEKNIDSTNSKLIQTGNVYTFKLCKTRFNLDFLTHDRYIISDRDTLWREGNDEKDVPYYSSNTKGLLIKED